MNKDSNIGILAFVPDVWSATWMSRHHILKGLSAHHKVLWVSPPTYVDGWLGDGVQSSLAGRGLKKLSDKMWCYAPHLPADYKYRYEKGGFVACCFRFYHKIFKKFYVRCIKRLLKKMGIDEVILYIWRPDFHWALEQFNARLVCYHIVDEYSFDPNKDHEISSEELKMLDGSDLVFIHSKTLMAKKGHLNPNTYEVPNGVDFGFYQLSLKNDPSDPEDMAEIPYPRIGYMGHIKRHIDLPLLYEIAKTKPEWSIVMIGPVRENHLDIEEDVTRLRALPNVYFLGRKPTSELPLYINALDVCLMPYRKTNYTKYIYPLKMHEYFACGKPVVATELKNLKEFSAVLEFAETTNEWKRAIAQALGSISNQERMNLIMVAENNSWKIRVKSIQGAIEESLKNTL